MAGYLRQEVLARLRPEERELLLRTSVLEEVTPDLAATLTGRSDAGRVLSALHSEHAFVFAAGADGPTMRYHRLLRRLLLEELEEGADQLADLHSRAAGGWEAAGDPLRAARHRLRAGEVVAAAETMEGAAESMMTGPRAEEVAESLGRLPADVVEGRPPLLLARAVLSVGRSPDDEAIDGARDALERLTEAGDDARSAAAAFWLIRAIGIAGDVPGGIPAAARSLDRIVPRHRPAAAQVALAALLGRAARFDEAETRLAAAEAAPIIRPGSLGPTRAQRARRRSTTPRAAARALWRSSKESSRIWIARSGMTSWRCFPRFGVNARPS